MASRWNAVECHGILWDTEDCHSLYGFHDISMAFKWNTMASRWNVVECHGISWDTEDRIILTVESHGYWDSVINWVWNTLECHEIKNLANQQHFQRHDGPIKKFSRCRPWSKLE